MLDEEVALRRQAERVASMRRQLPAGGTIPEDYRFIEVTPDGDGDPRHLSELFTPNHDTLLIYSMMLKEGGTPCPSCTAIVTGLDRISRQFGAYVDFAVVAKASVPTLRDFAARMDWLDLRLLSWGGTGYGPAYLSEDPDGGQMPMLNVFARDADYVPALQLSPERHGLDRSPD